MEFGSLVDSLIHDRIACSIDSKEITDRLQRWWVNAKQSCKYGKRIQNFKNSSIWSRKKGYQHIFYIWKKCLKCRKLNNLASACRSKYKINDINDTNSNNESDADVNELCIDHGGSSVNTKDNEITLDATLNDFNITPLNLILEHNVT